MIRRFWKRQLQLKTRNLIFLVKKPNARPILPFFPLERSEKQTFSDDFKARGKNETLNLVD